jgi:hypothetical protein
MPIDQTGAMSNFTANNWEAPFPVLFNPWKHHAGFLRQRISAASANADALRQLPSDLMVIGAALMDLYTGTLTPREIGEQILQQLQIDKRDEEDAYSTWLHEAGEFRTLTLADQSVWTLRLGELHGRYVHVHPGRWTPHTCRVRANALKTAMIVLAHIAVHGGDPSDVRIINEVRTRCLGLSPIGKLEGDHGLKGMIDLLRGDASSKRR